MQFSILLSLSVVAILTVQAAPTGVVEKRSTPLLPTCNIKCTKEYAPVCAVSTKNSKFAQTFSTKCTLSAFNCENPDNTFVAVANGACAVDGEIAAVEKRSTPLLPTCNIKCTKEYSPVCAVSTKNNKFAQTFSTKCTLSVFNCENPDNTFVAVANNACDVDGEIATVEKRSTPLLPTCNIKCTKEYAPVCAVSTKNNKFAQTFSTKCTLSVFNCQNPDNTFVAVANGACAVDGEIATVEKRSTPLLPTCNIKCTKEYSPVCAVSTKNNKFAQTFSTKCTLSVFNCENPDNTFVAVANGACAVDGEIAAVEKRSTPLLPTCNIKCTKEYAPVCAVSTKNNKFAQTFSTKCTLSVFNCENPDNTFVAVANGACAVDGEIAAVEKRSTPLLPKCDTACTLEYNPVCTVSTKNSQHSQTFSNQCFLSVFNCENPDNTFRAVSQDNCSANDN